MVQTIILETIRIKKQISIPGLKEICPKEKCFYSDGTFYIIYKDDDKTYPNVGEIDEDFCHTYKKYMIKCYISREDTLLIIENILFSNIHKREAFATLVEELSKLHNTKGKRIEDVKIEYDKIEYIYRKYGNMLVHDCDVYKFCYYWISLCIALDFRVSKGSLTVIHRAPIVRDAIAYIRGQIKREEYGRDWDEIKERVDPTKMIINVEWSPVKGHERELTSDRFVHKKGEKIPVEPHGRLNITTE